jgi:hypothetical protein
VTSAKSRLNLSFRYNVHMEPSAVSRAFQLGVKPTGDLLATCRACVREAAIELIVESPVSKMKIVCPACNKSGTAKVKTQFKAPTVTHARPSLKARVLSFLHGR